MLFRSQTAWRRGADLRWRSLPQAEAPTEPAGETGCGQPRYRMGQVFTKPETPRQISVCCYPTIIREEPKKSAGNTAQKGN